MKINRRNFIKTTLYSSIAFAGGLPGKAAWGWWKRPKKKLCFVFFTDVHARIEWKTPVAMEKAALAINDEKPDFVIAGGDFITDGFQSSSETVEPRWQAYKKMNNTMKKTVYPAIGNHDLVAAIPEDGSPASNDPRRIFREAFGLERTYYSFDTAGYHFIVLDSIFITGGELKYIGFIWPEQLEWLKQDLAAVKKETPIILITHIPLLTAFYQATAGAVEMAPANRVVVNNRNVLECFYDHNLILVLQGHLHVNEMLKWRGTTFITGGAVCGKWWRGFWHGTGEGFGLVTLKDNRVQWEYIMYGWKACRPAHL